MKRRRGRGGPDRDIAKVGGIPIVLRRSPRVTSTGTAPPQDALPAVPPRSTLGRAAKASRDDAAAAAAADEPFIPSSMHACELGDCTLIFQDLQSLAGHQDGPAHNSTPYYCPLTAEHCPRAPCDRALGGPGPSFIGRAALRSHLKSVHRGHTASACGLDLSWVGLAAFREAFPREASVPARTCNLDGCTRVFSNLRRLVAHQEGPDHEAVPYYCPLTAEHCPRAPCSRALGGPGPSFIGRDALVCHLKTIHHGHTGSACGLDLSWAGLAAFREAFPREAPAVAPPRGVPVFSCDMDGCTMSFDYRGSLLAHQEGPAHLAIPYFCPLTAEHCPDAPCCHAVGGRGSSLIGRKALRQHLREFHHIDTRSSCGLDLSWVGLASFRDKSLRVDGPKARHFFVAGSALAPALGSGAGKLAALDSLSTGASNA